MKDDKVSTLEPKLKANNIKERNEQRKQKQRERQPQLESSDDERTAAAAASRLFRRHKERLAERRLCRQESVDRY